MHHVKNDSSNKHNNREGSHICLAEAFFLLIGNDPSDKRKQGFQSVETRPFQSNFAFIPGSILRICVMRACKSGVLR